MLEEIDKPDGSKRFMKRRAATQCREHSRRSAPDPDATPASQPASQAVVASQAVLPLYPTRYIVALCREDDPAPCPRVATPAQPLHHPDIAQYFGAFDPQRGYLPTAELAALYPDG